MIKRGKTENKKNLINIHPDLIETKEALIQRLPSMLVMNLNPISLIHHPLIIHLLYLKVRDKEPKTKEKNHLIHHSLIHHPLILKEKKKELNIKVKHQLIHLPLIHHPHIHIPLDQTKSINEKKTKEKAHLTPHLILRTIILHIIQHTLQAQYLQHPYAH
jgi:hypothetical protein